MCECESDSCPSTHSAKDVILNFRDEENELEMQREVGEEEKLFRNSKVITTS